MSDKVGRVRPEDIVVVAGDEFPLRVTVDLPLELKDAALLLETIDQRIQTLRMTEHMMGPGVSSYHRILLPELQDQRRKIQEAAERLIRTLPMSPMITRQP